MFMLYECTVVIAWTCTVWCINHC